MRCTRSILSMLLSVALLFMVVGQNSASAISTDSQIQGSILYVKPGANGSCSSWTDACELQTALFNAVAGDQIWVAAGTYKPTADTDRTATFQLKSGVSIYGGFPAAGGEMADRHWETNITTLSGEIGLSNDNSDNSFHVVTGSGVDTTAEVDGFTISGGNANGSNENSSGSGMYNSGGNFALTNVIFSSNLAVNGTMRNTSGNPSLTNVTFFGNTGRAMFNLTSNPTLTDVTFENNSDGGMYNSSSNPALTNVNFSNNTATWGGAGMLNNNSSPTLTNVTFNNNSAGYNGGGMLNEVNPPIDGFPPESNPTLNNVIFAGNSAASGGGMYNYSSSPNLSDVTFVGNTSSNNGGGMTNYQSSNPSLINVSFIDNTASSGGGMYNVSFSVPYLTNVTLSNNTASNFGGGIYNFSSTASLSTVTFFSNNAGVDGGGIYNDASGSEIINSILWGNTPNQIAGSATVNYSDIQGGHSGVGNINQDPRLGPLADNGGFTLTHALRFGSPAIDMGNPTVCPATDQRGFTRPFDGDGDGISRCDLGAYESQITPNFIYLPSITR